MMYWGGHMGTGDWLGSILVTVLIVALIVWVVRMIASTGQRQTPSEPAQPREPSARELLDRRLASGEITTEQYRELRAALDGITGQPSTPSPAAQ
jgi:uncharacterized membrane protein